MEEDKQDKRQHPLGISEKRTEEAGHKGHKGFSKFKDMASGKFKGKKLSISQMIIKKAKTIGIVLGAALIGLLAVFGGGIKAGNDRAVDSTTAALYAATGQPQTSSYAEYDIQLDLQPIKVVIGENRRYNLEFDITEYDKREVESILMSHNILLTEENTNFIAALMKSGAFLIDEYLTQERLELLLLFYKADIASKSLDLRLESDMYKDGEYVEPSFEEEGIPGIIRVNQYRINPENNETTEVHLIYAKEDEFAENMDGHFTIDDSGNLVVANTSQTTVLYEYPENYTGEKKENTTINTNNKKSINFKPIIAKSSLPFRLMEAMRRNINDSEFHRNILSSVSKSNIVLALKEEETESIKETITTYTPRIEEYYDFTYKLGYGTGENTVTSQGEEHPLKPDTGKNYTKLGYGAAFNVKETTITKSYKQELEIKEIRNWFMNYNIAEYLGNTEVNVDGPNETEIELPDYTGLKDEEIDKYLEFTGYDLPEDEIISNFKTEKENEINTDGASTEFTWNIEGKNYKNTEDLPTKINITTTTTTTTITKGEETSEYRKQDSEGSFLYYLSQSESAQYHFKNPGFCIYDELEVDTVTQDLVTILKYLMYLYTGDEEFNVTPIDLNSLVGTIDFASFGGEFNNIEYTVQFSWSDHDSYAKTVDGIEFYQLYGDKGDSTGKGNPTIGRGDINLCVHQDQLHRLNGKKGKYLINGTTVSTEEVDIDIYMKQQLGVSSYSEAKEKNINSFEIWVEAAPLDEVANDIWNEFKGTTEAALQSADISLKDQQIDALVALEYAAGYIYGDFINTYNDAIRCRFRN